MLALLPLWDLHSRPGPRRAAYYSLVLNHLFSRDNPRLTCFALVLAFRCFSARLRTLRRLAPYRSLISTLTPVSCLSRQFALQHRFFALLPCRTATPLPYLNYVTSVSAGYVPIYFVNRASLVAVLREKLLINQSSLVLTDLETELLCVGLNFIPFVPQAHSTVNKLVTASLTHWTRTVDCAIHFSTPDVLNNVNLCSEPDKGWLGSLAPSTWEPPSSEWVDDPTVLNCFSALASILSPVTVPAGPDDNDVRVRDSIRSLSKATDVHIVKADKGRSTVLWAATDYDIEARRQLSDTSTYEPLTRADYLTRLRALARLCRETASELLYNGYITLREHAAMIDIVPGLGSTIYFLPKIHKPPHIATGSYPGRPIVATFSSPLHLIDKFITNLTAPLLPLIPGSLRDTSELISLLRAPFSPPLSASAVIVTADVDSLYPNCDLELAINDCCIFYKKHLSYLRDYAREHRLLPPPNLSTFAELLRLVVTNSFLHFKESLFFRQTTGTAMGMCISVFFANVHMYEITRRYIDNPVPGVRLFLRYIDDIVVIFDDADDAKVYDFFLGITTKLIKYTVDRVSKSQAFLDLKISINQVSYEVEFAPYWKPTASGSFIHPSTCHPPHVIRGIPYSQFLRLRRNSSSVDTFQVAAKRLFRELKRSGYPVAEINRSYKRVLTSTPGVPRRGKNLSASAFRLVARYDRRVNMAAANSSIRALHSAVIEYFRSLPPTTATLRAITVLSSRSSSIVSSNPRCIGSFFTGFKHGFAAERRPR